VGLGYILMLVVVAMVATDDGMVVSAQEAGVRTLMVYAVVELQPAWVTV